VIEGTPSHTSLRVALHRAAHQFRDQPRLFEDPLALRIVGAEHEAGLRADAAEPESLPRTMLRNFVAARSRYAEDRLAESVTRGLDQYVVLGAGLDTFAYRQPPAGLRLFEVDHPATQAWKRQLLATAGIAAPASLRYIAVDFEKQDLRSELERGGLDFGRPAFFAWLGVTPYLARETIFATLRLIASFPAGSGVAFDFGVPPDGLSERARRAFDIMAERVAAAGEPWVSFLDPNALAVELKALGFGTVEILYGESLSRRFYPDHQGWPRLGSVGGLAGACR
jgi:methyltransferase (TIGR00027 family)